MADELPDRAARTAPRGRLRIATHGGRAPPALEVHPTRGLSIHFADGTSEPLHIGTTGEFLEHLAKARLEDEAAGRDLAGAGWRRSVDVATALGITPDHLNVLTYRARGALAKLRVKAAIERHRGTASLRLAGLISSSGHR
jgi:hypothetical protein